MAYGSLALDEISTSGNLAIAGNVAASGNLAITGNVAASGNVTTTGFLRPSALRGTAAATAPVFQDSAGTQIGTLARAWVNFDGTGTVAIRAAFNVSSIVDHSTGAYSVVFATAMPDVNYSAVISTSPPYTVTRNCSVQMASTQAATEVAPTTSQYRFSTSQGNTAAGTEYDAKYITASFFR
jgi:hypothetical protein